MKGIILAATKGTYLEPITEGIPKSLIKFLGKSLLQHTIEAFRAAGIHDLVVVVGYESDKVIQELGSGEPLGVSLTYIKQEKLEGVGSALLTAEKVLRGDVRFILKKLKKLRNNLAHSNHMRSDLKNWDELLETIRICRTFTN